MTRPEPRLEDIPASSLRFLGRDVQRIDDVALVTGSVEFIDNVSMPELLHCAIKYSTVAHGRIRRIDTSRAEALPGVVAVITGAEVLASTNRSRASRRAPGRTAWRRRRCTTSGSRWRRWRR